MNIVEDSTDDLTVLIRNKNEEQHIGFAIQSVIDHFLKPEILVLDNNSSDDSLGVVNLFKDRADIKVINIENYTPGKSINEGVLNSTKSKILILSAHCQISEMDYGMVLDKLNKHVTVFGKQIPIYKGKKISPRYIWSHFGEKEEVNMYSVIEQRPFLHNAFSFYDKKHLLKIHLMKTYQAKKTGTGLLICWKNRKAIFICQTLKSITFLLQMEQHGKA